MAQAEKNLIRTTKRPIKTKVKMGGTTLVSEALVKAGVTNLVPKIHVKKGDLVMVISGSKEMGKGRTGKVLNVFPKTGKVIVEGINVVTRATKAKSAMGKSGLIKKEAPIFACKVMLYSTEKKKPFRAEFRKKLGLD
ncbi:50S ribosomal protein L24 [soil metagenome]